MTLGCLSQATFAHAAPIALGISTSQPVGSEETGEYIRAAGAAPQIDMWFVSFGSPLVWRSAMAAVSAMGATPMITWDPAEGGRTIPFSAIADGRYDDYLVQQARLAAAQRTVIDIRFAHEMNVRSPATPWGQADAAEYIAAWRHVVGLFRAQGATNVQWVWAPNVDCGGGCPFDRYYPGDAWVDYVGLDGYNFAAVHHVRWESLAEVFGSSYRDIARLSAKPVMFTEVATTGQGGDKAAWIRSGFLSTIPTMFPRVVAVIWWERNDQTNWQITSSKAAEAAWRAVVASPLYGGDGASGTALSGSRAGQRIESRACNSSTGPLCEVSHFAW